MKPIRLMSGFFTVGIWTLISRVMGFIRDVMIAGYLGSGPAAEAFLVAFSLPNMFRRFFAEGAFNMAFVPMFLGYICFGYGLSRVRASTATTLTLIEPVVAAVLAVVIVGERLPALGWIGVGLVVVCLLVLTIPRGHRAQTVPPIPSE